MISAAVLRDAMFETMKRASLYMPPDVKQYLERALEEECEPLAKAHLSATLKNAEMAEDGCGLICADTGFPLFFVKAGPDVSIEGGFAALRQAARDAVKQATEEHYLRPTMVDPLSRSNNGVNLGSRIPSVVLEFTGTGDTLEITAVPKGGGSEIFGTFYQMMYPSDGAEGIKKFIYDSVINGCYAGKICPPAIVGVGIGGTADICMAMAKHAAVLRPLGVRSDNPEAAELEVSLEEAFRRSGIGPMGSKGIHAVMGVHIETEVTHTAALPVAVNAQCCIGRRWKCMIDGACAVTYSGV